MYLESAIMEELICPEDLKSNFLFFLQKHIQQMEETFHINISLRGNKLMFEGNPQNKKQFKSYIDHLFQVSRENGEIEDNDFMISLSMAREGRSVLIRK